MVRRAILSLVVVAACGGARPNHLVAADAFEVDLPGPARDLGWKGGDSRVGGYAVAGCTLGFDAGMYQGGLEPSTLDWPDEWRYRVKAIDGRPARWVTYRAVTPGWTGPYWVGVYVPGLAVQVACPTAAARDR